MTKIEEKYDLTGKKFGRLRVIKYSNVRRNGRARYWVCKCDCGKSAIIRGSFLKDGTTKSCGCFNTETRKKQIRRISIIHGHSNTKEFNAWRGMLGRCNNHNNPKYNRYGARGIKVCKRWGKSFINFYTDMGKAPSKLHSLDRKKNNRGYCKSNCRWATSKEQANNTSTNRKVIINGNRIGIIEATKLLGISYYFLSKYLKNKLSINEIKKIHFNK